MGSIVATPVWNGYDGIINDKPFMPGFSPERQAMTLMELAELDGERLGPEERELVIQYARAIKDYREVAGLVSELCEYGYELQFGAPDPGMVSYIDREITRAKEVGFRSVTEKEVSPMPYQSNQECEPASQTATPTEDEHADLAAPAVPDDDEAAKRQAHEEAEAKRKAEWEAKQQQKKAAEQEKLERLAAMSDEAAIAAAVTQVSDATDKMTNRSMKDSVSAHLQGLCQADPAFARLTMHPRKSMLHCIQYIFRQARDYLEKELKAANVKTAGTYGGDVPDGLCYQWAEDYFRDPDAKEDAEPEDKFVERPFIGTRTAKAKSEPKPKPAPKAKACPEGQFSLFGEAV